MSKEQMMQEFVSSAITPLLERVVVKKLIQSFEVIADQQKADLAAAKARIAELEKALEPFAREYGSAIEEAYKEGWGDSNSDFDYEEDDWDASRSKGCVRRAAALLNKEAS